MFGIFLFEIKILLYEFLEHLPYFMSSRKYNIAWSIMLYIFWYDYHSDGFENLHVRVLILIPIIFLFLLNKSYTNIYLFIID